MYKALYRKYRPLTFSDVLGQNHITKTLQNQISEERTSHAYIFTGTRGTGKTSCAKILARAINCTNPINGNPCNECEACKSILSESAVDVSELDAASNNKVDDIRQILDETRYTPSMLKKRIYIIDEVHMLTTQAFNALLKTLEEPPSYVVFILATTEIHKVLPTILSRCQRFDFRRISSNDIAKHLVDVAKKEGIDLDFKAAEIIAKLADGGLRDALSILDRCIAADNSKITSETVCERVGVLDFSDLLSLTKAIFDGDTILSINKINEMYISGKELASILEQMVNLFRDMILYKVDNSYVTIYNSKEFITLSDQVLSQTLAKYIEIISQTLPNLSKSHSKKIDTEMCIIKLCNYINMLSSSEISERLEILEDKITNFKPVFIKNTEENSDKPEKTEKPKEIKKKTEKINLEGKEDIHKLAKLFGAMKKVIPISKFMTIKSSTKILFSDIEILIYGNEFICQDIINIDTKLEIQRIAREIFDDDIIVRLIISDTTEKNDTKKIDEVLNLAQKTNIKVKITED